MAAGAATYPDEAMQIPLESIFDLTVGHPEFFREVDSLPNIKDFIKSCPALGSILRRRWEEQVRDCRLPLVVNILIHPNLLFCHQDAIKGQYRRYFQPIYLDSLASAVSRGEIGDEAALRIVELHKKFEEYDLEVENRDFVSLNDIEAILKPASPFPPPGSLISILRDPSDASEFMILADHKTYKAEVENAVARIEQVKPLYDVRRKFNKYLELVTAHGGSYHQVTIGSSDHWVGRVYLAFRDSEAQIGRSKWIQDVKNYAFDALAPMALGCTFLRNRDIVQMLEEVRELLRQASNLRVRHISVFDQFLETRAQRNHKMFPAAKHVYEGDFAGIQQLELPGLALSRGHLEESCVDCVGKENSFRHALGECSQLGAAFLADICSILEGVEELNLNESTREYIANAIAFGLTRDHLRPGHLKKYFEAQHISTEWMTCCKAAQIESEVIRPYVLALLLMTGNRAMVDSNASGFGVCLQQGPSLERLTTYRGQIIAEIKYNISGNLAGKEEVELDSHATSQLHKDKNLLLLHFGRHFLDDFQMYIRTATPDGGRVAQYRWLGRPITSMNSITYLLRCSA